LFLRSTKIGKRIKRKKMKRVFASFCPKRIKIFFSLEKKTNFCLEF
jgi:hypothetical protein